MRITIKTPSGRCAAVYSEGQKVFASSLELELLPLSDLDWIKDEGFADYVVGKITGIEQPCMLPANGEVST